MGDLKHKHPSEDWELKPDPIGRAARFVNHPDSLPDIDTKPDDPQPPTNNKIKDTKYSLRRASKTPQKLDLGTLEPLIIALVKRQRQRDIYN